MWKRRWLPLLVLGFAAFHTAGGDFAAAGQEPVPVRREILALYDGAQEGDVNLTRIHRLAEMPLNHLGFIVRFHDVRTKLPEPAEIERYRGVLTWFVGLVPDGNAYLAWASRVSRMNTRYVILGDIGVEATSPNILAINRLLDAAGVRHTGDLIAPTLGTHIARKDASLIDFECGLDPNLPDYPVLESARSDTRIGLGLETPAHDGSRNAVTVAIGRRGGYAALNYEFCHQRPPVYQGRWFINPFAFFSAAFAAGNIPIPDTTTVSGNRLYFSQLESEGWSRLSKIEGFRDSAATVGEVVMRQLVEAFDDLPVTIDLTEKKNTAGRNAEQVRQRALASRNVDVAARPLRATASRFDSEYPSISNLSPLVSAGPDHSVNQAMGDETSYGGAMPTGENGFVAHKETVRNTEAPRRLKPLDLNYHAYAGEYPALLRSVRDQLLEVRMTAVTPVSANRYVRIVDGFFSARIDRVESTAWQISNRGALQTVRFDNADGQEVDVQSSIGVIGQRRDEGTLYVALDESTEPVLVVLGPPFASGTSAHHLVLVQSRWLIRDVVKDDCAVTFQAQGYGDGSFTWTGAAGRYLITALRGGHEIWQDIRTADGAGRLEFTVPSAAIDPTFIRIKCAVARSEP